MKTISAIIAIALLLGFALYQGIDGAVLATGVGLIAGLGGYAIKRRQPPKT